MTHLIAPDKEYPRRLAIPASDLALLRRLHGGLFAGRVRKQVSIQPAYRYHIARSVTEVNKETTMRMRKQPILMAILGAVLLAVLSGTLYADEDDPKTLFYNLTTDESWAAGMALGQASMAQQSGYQVVVFLNVRGVYLAQESRAQDTFSGTGKTPKEMLASLHENGARLVICPMCMKKAGIAESDLVPNVELGGPKVTFPLMTADDTVVLSY